jgi:hypothetical protein
LRVLFVSIVTVNRQNSIEMKYTWSQMHGTQSISDSSLFAVVVISDPRSPFIRVKEVTQDHVTYEYKDKSTGKVIQCHIPSNFVLWSTGIAMNPFTQRVSELLPNQVHRKVRA